MPPSPFEDNRPPDRSPRNKNERGVLLILGFFFGLFLLMELARDFTPAKWSVPFFLLSYILLLWIHEMGHAIMARLVGWRVSLICIGSGKVRSQGRILGMPIEYRTIPLSGFVRPEPSDLIAPRLKEFLIYSAGPGVELLLVAGIAAALGPDTLLQRTEVIGGIAAQSFCVAALFGALLNLIPLPHQTEQGAAWSDGLGMILCWRLPDAWFQGRIEAARKRQDLEKSPPT